LTDVIGENLETVEKLLDKLENSPEIDLNDMERLRKALEAVADEMLAASPNSLNLKILEDCVRRFEALCKWDFCKREDGDRH
jgi:chloramphenicol 3-O-phosphotransferase